MERNTIVCGDALEVMRGWPDGCVQMCVTSPPYWGLRDYGVDGQLGLESTPELYVEHLVEIMREVRRVLRDDGTLWLNLGDSYAGSMKGIGADGSYYGGEKQRTNAGSVGITPYKPDWSCVNLKPKDLVGIPWRVAFALQADGWWLRSDIIWSKPNPMPESVRDRPTKAHEYVFLLSKSKRYYYDADAVREPIAASTANDTRLWKEGYTTDRPERGYPGGASHGSGMLQPSPTGRNRRTVWTIATKPFSGAHFAVFPPDLIEPCILAGTSARGCCPECGAGWERVVERTSKGKSYAVGKSDDKRGKGLATAFSGYDDGSSCPTFTTTGWQPTCDCFSDDPAQTAWDVQMGLEEYDPVRCIVLDPFMGAGTTALVALEHNRGYVGIELNPDYIEIAERRLAQVTGVQLPLIT